jgi:anti-anti-sigma factor
MAPNDSVRIEEREGVNVIHLKGHLDLETAPRMKPPLMEEAQKPNCKIVLDLEYMYYISSFGLSLLLQLNDRVKASKGRLALAALNPFAKQVFDTTQLTTIFKIYDSVEAATKALSQP